MTRSLARLLSPRSIAIVGGGRWGEAAVRSAGSMGFEGPVWPVHPSRPEIEGRTAYPDLAALPDTPDAAFVAVNKRATTEVVATLSEMGAGGAVCFASGFGEAGEAGAEGQAALVAAANGMPVLGPNCYGFVNALAGAALWPDVHGLRRVERGVALVAQSSNILLNLTMQARGLPVAYAVAVGNQAQTGLTDIALQCLADPRVTAVGLYVEGIGDLRRLEALAAAARSAGKPVVALRIGRTESSRRSAVSHTAALTGADAAAAACFRRLGIGEVESLPGLLQALMLAHVHGALPGRRVVSMSCSGGEAALMGDAGARRRITFPDLGDAVRERLRSALGEHVALANPLDYHTDIWGREAPLRETYSAMCTAGASIALLVLDYPRAELGEHRAWDRAASALAQSSRATGTPAAIVATLPDCLSDRTAAGALEEGIAPLTGVDDALAAVDVLADIREAWAAEPPLPALLPPKPAQGAPALLDERMAKVALAAHGMPVPQGRFAANRAEATGAAAEIGFPVALKALGVAHKTEHGALRLGLPDEQAVFRAAEAMAAPEGYLVEAMVEGGLCELLVGVVRDPVYGFVLTLGAGGTLTEILDDSISLTVPADAEAVRAALGGLRIAPLLAGHRGRPPVDLAAAIHAILCLEAFVEAEAERLLEVEVNPLILCATGAVAADALIRVTDTAR